VAFLIIAVWTTPTAQARRSYDFYFVADNGTVVLGKVDLDVYRSRGAFTARLTIAPTYNEHRSLDKVLSHVDFGFTFWGLYATDDDPSHKATASTYVRFIKYVGDEDIDEFEDPRVDVKAFN